MANWSGIAATLTALVRPHRLQPRLVVPSIANLDWHALKHHANVHAVVIDKDNCIARPNEDSLADDAALRASWASLLSTFGPDKVLVVSNSAGDLRKDPLLIQAETVSRNLQVPVLVHRKPKPAYDCAKQIAAHFLASSSSSSPSPSSSSSTRQASQVVYSPLAKARHSLKRRAIQSPDGATATSSRPSQLGAADSATNAALRVLVIGDRLATDMILSHRLASLSLPLSVPPPSASSSALSRLWPFTAKSNPAQQLGHRGQKIETISVLTTTLWGREGAGTWAMRGVERGAVWALEKRQRQRRVRDWDREEVVVDWRRYTIGMEQKAPLRTTRLVEEERRNETAATAGRISSAPLDVASTRRRGTLPSLPSIDFSALSLTVSNLSSSLSPSRLSHFITSTLPTRFSSFMHSFPERVHDLATRIGRGIVGGAERYGPRVVKGLEVGLRRLVDVYQLQPTTRRKALEHSSSSTVVSTTTTSARIDKALDSLEQRWAEAGRTVDALRNRLGASRVEEDGKKAASSASAAVAVTDADKRAAVTGGSK
ncbi:hypothetical protein JCM10908_004523 [Rhodotorula pacifica]|uniref:phosphatidylglycerophosphatase n=1 Tax=Rhodotorula pacifica TaxID=1495444 RepID=UPI00317FBFEA